jgi:hypothetical protein
VLCERSCITYVRLSTNKNRQIMVGSSQTSSPLVPSAPAGTVPASAGTSSVRFLGFFKGYTDIPNVSAKVRFYLPLLICSSVACYRLLGLKPSAALLPPACSLMIGRSTKGDLQCSSIDMQLHLKMMSVDTVECLP